MGLRESCCVKLLHLWWWCPLSPEGSPEEFCCLRGLLGTREAEVGPEPTLTSAEGFPAGPHSMLWERGDDQRWPAGGEPCFLEMEMASVEESF